MIENYLQEGKSMEEKLFN